MESLLSFCTISFPNLRNKYKPNESVLISESHSYLVLFVRSKLVRHINFFMNIVFFRVFLGVFELVISSFTFRTLSFQTLSRSKFFQGFFVTDSQATIVFGCATNSGEQTTKKRTRLFIKSFLS